MVPWRVRFAGIHSWVPLTEIEENVRYFYRTKVFRTITVDATAVYALATLTDVRSVVMKEAHLVQ